jgi:cyanate lyase
MPSIREGLASKLHTLRSIAMTGDTLNHAFLLHARLTFKDPLFSHKTQNLAKKYITLASPEECTTLDFKAPVALNAFETFTTSALFGLFNVRVEDTKKAEQSLELATKIVTKLTGNAPNQVSAEPKTSTHLNWQKTFKGIRENFDFSQEIIKTDLLKTLYNTTKSKEAPYENPSNPIIYRYIIPAVLTIVGLTIFTSTFIPLMLSSLNWSVMSICMISLATTSFTLSVLGGFSYLNFHGSGLNHSIEQIKSWSFNADPAPPAAQPSIASKTASLTFKGGRLPSM